MNRGGRGAAASLEASLRSPHAPAQSSHTYLHLGRYQEAIEAYLKSLPLVPEDNLQARSEQALNLAMAYDQLHDSSNRDAWLAKAKAWAPAGTPVADYFAKQAAAGKKLP